MSFIINSFRFAQAQNLWTPSEITTVVWYDPSQTDTITESLGLVSQLDDIGSTGTYHLTQGTAGDQLTTGIRTIGGLNVLDGDGSGAKYMKDTSVPMPSTGGCSFFIVAEIEGSVFSTDSLYSIDSGSNDFQFDANTGGGWNGRINQSGLGSTLSYTGGPYEDTGQHIFSTVFDYSTEIRGWIDGIDRGSVSMAGGFDSGPYELILFANRGENNSPNGAAGEFIVCQDITTDIRQKIEGYLAWKWDGGVAGTLVGNLASDHPYKSSAPTV